MSTMESDGVQLVRVPDTDAKFVCNRGRQLMGQGYPLLSVDVMKKTQAH
jgi:hypothetical protein